MDAGCRGRKILASWAYAALAVMIVFTGRAAAQELPPQAREVLDRLLGEWTTHTHIRKWTSPPREFQTAGTAICRQTLETRFYEFRTASIPPGEADLQVMTFDVDAGCYRQWVFGSDGYYHEATGTWDPATTTLRWTGKQAGNTFVIDDHWVSGERLEWKLRRTGTEGELLQTIEGVLERVGE